VHQSEHRKHDPLSYTVPDAMAVTGLGRTKLYELLNAGKLRSVTIGRRRLIAADSVRSLIAGEAA